MRRVLSIIVLLAAGYAPAWAEQEAEYLAVFMQGKKVGHAIHVRAVEGDEVTTSEEVSITISRLGIPITVRMTETSVETTTGRPLRFESVQFLGAMKMTVSGTVRDDGVVEVTNSSMGMQQKSTMDWPEGAVMAEGLRRMTLEKGLTPGAEYRMRIFNAGIMQAIDVVVSIGAKQEVDLLGRVVKLTEVTSTLVMPGAGRVSSTSYVDDDMRALKSNMLIAGIDVEMISCARQFALGDNDVLELIGAMFIDSPAPLRDPRSASAITYWLGPTDAEEFTIPTMDNQQAERLDDGTIKLVVRPVPSPAGGTFPYEGDDRALLEAVAPTRFLQSDRKEIIELARKAVGDARDAAEAARRIETFVADYIDDKNLSVGYASAAEVAASRQGDCTEFAVLTAALCRAVGIPAQVVVGVAYVDDFAGHQGFGGHAWAQAYIAGRWVGLDAAFKSGGRGGYGPSHIALAAGNGDPAEFFNIAGALGRFKIERLEVEQRR